MEVKAIYLRKPARGVTAGVERSPTFSPGGCGGARTRPRLRPCSFITLTELISGLLQRNMYLHDSHVAADSSEHRESESNNQLNAALWFIWRSKKTPPEKRQKTPKPNQLRQKHSNETLISAVGVIQSQWWWMGGGMM